MKIALSHAHAIFAKGAAYGPWEDNKRLTEWDRSQLINGFMSKIFSQDEVFIIDPDGKMTYKEHLNKTIEDINNCGADLAVETHFNSSANPRAHGFEVLYNERSSESRKLAFFIFDAFKNNIPVSPRSIIPRRDIALLKFVKCPCVIVECGFLSNYYDRAFIYRPDSTELLATNIAKGILAYKDQRRQV